jgi:regulator of sirC expression with transglutaminase-like and TPR domain
VTPSDRVDALILRATVSARKWLVEPADGCIGQEGGLSGRHSHHLTTHIAARLVDT